MSVLPVTLVSSYTSRKRLKVSLTVFCSFKRSMIFFCGSFFYQAYNSKLKIMLIKHLVAGRCIRVVENSLVHDWGRFKSNLHIFCMVVRA